MCLVWGYAPAPVSIKIGRHRHCFKWTCHERTTHNHNSQSPLIDHTSSESVWAERSQGQSISSLILFRKCATEKGRHEHERSYILAECQQAGIIVVVSILLVPLQLQGGRAVNVCRSYLWLDFHLDISYNNQHSFECTQLDHFRDSFGVWLSLLYSRPLCKGRFNGELWQIIIIWARHYI